MASSRGYVSGSLLPRRSAEWRISASLQLEGLVSVLNDASKTRFSAERCLNFSLRRGTATKRFVSALSDASTTRLSAE